MRAVHRTALVLSLGLAACASSPATRTPRSNTPARDDVVLYTVQSGDSLIRLATRFHVDGGAEGLARLNGIERPDLLRAGRGILVPINAPYTDGLARYHPPATSTRSLHVCGDLLVSTRVFSPLTAAEIPGCRQAQCTSSLAVSVCACAAVDGNDAIIVRQGDAERTRWRAVFAPDAYDSLSGAWAHLEGNDAGNLVVAWLSTVGNSLSLQGWGVAVLGRDLRAPITFGANEFGNGSLLARESGPGCELLATEWTERRDAILGPGLYLLARAFRVGDGALRAVDEPALGRRLLQDFAQELAEREGHAPHGSAARWFDRGRAEVLPDEPVLDVAAARGGVVREVAVEASGPPGRVPRLTFAFDDGTTDAVVASASPDAPRLGDAATGVLYPRGYCPADPDALRGQRVRVATYATPSGAQRSVVWLGNAPSR